MPTYSEKVMDHFMNPRNVGEIENPDGIGEVGNPVCGDMMTFYISVDNNHLSDVKFKTFGCGAAIAVSSIVSEMAMGKTLEEARKITPAMVAKELEGLPKNKHHCSNLGADALKAAIQNFEDRKSGKVRPEPETKDIHEHSQDEGCYCPYCDAELSEELDFCQACKSKINIQESKQNP